MLWIKRDFFLQSYFEYFCLTPLFLSVFRSHSASNSRVSEISKIFLTFCIMSETRRMAVENVVFSSKRSIVIKLPVKHHLTPSHLGGGGGSADSPWDTFLNNSLTAQDIKMKFFRFNLTPMGVNLHLMTILINLRCCHGNLLLWMCRGIEKWRNFYICQDWRNFYICQDVGFILLKIGAGGKLLHSKSKINNEIFIRRHSDVKMT